jgi:hypothetical protein
MLSARLRGRHYRDVLLHDLPELLEDAPQAVRARMWYMHILLRHRYQRYNTGQWTYPESDVSIHNGRSVKES